MAKNIFHGTITNLANGVKSRFTKTSDSQPIVVYDLIENDETNVINKPANHCLIKNKSNQMVFIEFSQDVDKRYVLEANETLVFSPEDNFTFTDLQISNESGSTATGIIYATIGWLYEVK